MTKLNNIVTFFVALALGLTLQSNVAFAASSCNSVTLNGYVAPKNGPSTVWFEWSTNSSSVSSGSATKTASKTFSTNSYFSQLVTGLNESTTYYYRTAARNSNGTVYGSVVSFKTSTCTAVDPDGNSSVSATTNTATSVGDNNATLNGYITIVGSDNNATRWFEYGTNQNSLSNSTTHQTINYSGNISSSVNGLFADTTYYYRAVANGKNGVVRGSILSFRTLGGTIDPPIENPDNPPTSTNSSTCNSVTLNGYVAPKSGASTVWFEWSSNSSTVTSGGGTKTTTNQYTRNTSFSKKITGLSENTTYYYRTAARNSNGTVYGNVVSFKTSSCNIVTDNNSLSVTTDNAANVASTQAFLYGYVSKTGSASATRWFEYGTNQNSLSNSTSHLSVNSSSNISSYITGLTPGTTYYFRAVASGANGEVRGSILSFKTTGGNIENPTDEPPTSTNSSTCDSVTLNGYVAPKNGASTVWFEWSSNSSTVTSGGGTKTTTNQYTSNTYFSKKITGLSENTTYYYRTAAKNSNGTVYGNVVSFKTSTCTVNNNTLSVTTHSASNISENNATLNGYVSKTGTAAATRWFEYGTNQNNLSNSTTHTNVVGSADISAYISGLSVDTTYYFRAVATGANGEVRGSILSFKTSAGTNPPVDNDQKPSVITNSASDINQSSATLRGYINTTNAPGSEYWFKWGTSSTNLNQTTNRVAVSSSRDASAYISGLGADTTYYFQIVGSNSVGTSEGLVKSFRTDSSGDDNNDSDVTVTTKSATNVGPDSATLNGYVETNGSSNVTRWFEWGRTSSNLSNTTSQSSISNSGNVSSYISGLSSNTTYYFRVVAHNDNGTVYGSKYSFTTESDEGDGDPSNEPTVTTRSVTNVDYSRATLNGFVEANNTSNTYGWFEWGRSSNSLSNSTNKRSLGSSDSSISSTITGLTADTTYYYRAVAKNDEGSSYGNILNFTTSDSGNIIDDNNNDSVAPTAITMLATNVEGSTATLNSLVLQSGNVSSSAWFEWGTSQSLGRRTTTKNMGTAPSVRHAEYISGLTSGTTYYFRVVAENETGRNYGTINSFVAKSPVYIYNPAPTPVKKVITKKVVAPVAVQKTVTVVEHAEGVSSLVMLTITGEDDTITKGVGETYTVTWRNQSNQDLTNVVLRIIVPQSLTFESADDGTYSKADGIHTILIGKLNAGEEGEMNLVLKGSNTLNMNDLVVTTANIVYTDEYSIQGDALAYTTQRATSGTSVLGASVGTVGGISIALIGWLILIILIIILIIVCHNLYQRVTKKD